MKVEACKICDNNHAYCKYGNNCSMRGGGMTREEITKEAQEQVNCCTPLHPEDFIHGYIAGAEPREKRITELKSIAEFQQSSNMKRHFEIQKLEKENAELKEKCYKKAVKDYCKLEKENAELKKKIGIYQKGMYDEIEKRDRKLTKAKEIISAFVEWANWEGSNCPSFKSIQDNAEQFLKEIEK